MEELRFDTKRQIDIVIGNTAQKADYNWSVFADDYDQAISKVEFQLHPTFQPNLIVVSKRPFELKRAGWGTFDIGLKVHFCDKQVKEYSHELSFDESFSLKKYTVTVDCPRRFIEQMPTDDPRMMETLERKKYELRKSLKYQKVNAKEEMEKKKAQQYDSIISLNYKYHYMAPTKGNPATHHEVSVEDGNKRNEKQISLAMNNEIQKEILEMVRKDLSDLKSAEQEQVSKKPKKKVYSKKGKGSAATFSFSQPDVMGGGCKLNYSFKRDSENDKKTRNVLDWISQKME